MSVNYEDETCPEGMYPLDCDSVCDKASLKDLIEHCEVSSDILNLPLSWFLFPGDENEERYFQVVFVMPRKYCRTWSVRTNNFDTEESVAWVKEFTKQAATEWFGWDE